MAKTRVAVRIKDAVGGKSYNKSVDIQSLTDRFNVMKKKLALLTGALKKHHTIMEEMNNSRINVSSTRACTTSVTDP